MDNKLNLRVGENVDISFEQSRTYRTLVEDITEEGDIVISSPIYRGRTIFLPKEHELSLYCFRKNGRFGVEVKVIDYIMQGSLRLVVLKATSPPRKQQRRDSFRLPIMLKAIICHIADGPFPRIPSKEDELVQEQVVSNNISETGISIKTRVEYSVGDRIYVRVFLGWPDEKKAGPIDFLGEIRQVDIISKAPKVYSIGVRYLDCDDETRQHLARFIFFKQQQEAVRMKNHDYKW